MTVLEWDAIGEREYETGVSRGVLYKADGAGGYEDGVAWNGLTTVTESPTGAEANPQYADNIKYLNLYSAEELGGTIEAFTYPDEFAECDGSANPSAGVSVGQQTRKQFGLCYTTQVGNDTEGTDHGEKIHLIYGATASPSEKAYATINDSPEALGFSWEFETLKVPVTGLKPTALIVVDSTQVDSGAFDDLKEIVYGSAGSDARLPMPDEVIALFGGGVTVVNLNTLANQPTYNGATHVVTLPAVTGVQWKVNGVNKAPGAQPALAVGETAEVDATPTAGHSLEGDTDWSFDY